MTILVGTSDIKMDASNHAETVVLLGWRDVDTEYMYIDYEPDHRVFERGKTIYREITEYVQEKYGLHVTNLNIAQVKDKLGLDKRENYNFGKEGHRVPQVTLENDCFEIITPNTFSEKHLN